MVFTNIKIERDKFSRKIYINVGLLTFNNFKHMFSANMISNCTISVSDIRNYGKIYGPSIPSIKVKITRSKPSTVINDNIQIPSEIYNNNSNIELCFDIIYINSVAFLVSIDKKVKYRSIFQRILSRPLKN